MVSILTTTLGIHISDEDQNSLNITVESSKIPEKKKGSDIKSQLSITAAFCEWFLTLLIVAYMLTFVPDFRVLELGKLNLGFYDYSKTKDTNMNPVQANKYPTRLSNIYRNKKRSHNQQQNTISAQDCNFRTWHTRRQKNVSGMQFIKCVSYRDVGQQDLNVTLSSSSSYMSDSRTTNESLCDNVDHPNCRHLLESAHARRYSASGRDNPANSDLMEQKVVSTKSIQPTSISYESSNVDQISVCCLETA